MNKKRLYVYSLLLLTSIIWGISAPVIKYTLRYFDPLVFLSYRFLISSIISVIYFLLARPRFPASQKTTALVVFNSFLQIPVGLGLLFLAFDKTSSLSASVLTSLKPIAFVFAGFLFLGDHVTKQERKGLFITLLGFLAIVSSPILSGDNGQAHISFEGNLYVLANIFIDTVASVIAKKIMQTRVPSLALSQIGFIIGFITIAPIALYYYSYQHILSDILEAPVSAHMGVLYMSVLAGSLAHALRYRAVRSIELSETAVFGYLLPVFAAPLSILWLHETFSPVFIFGVVITVIGILIAETKKSTKKKFSRLQVHRQGL